RSSRRACRPYCRARRAACYRSPRTTRALRAARTPMLPCAWIDVLSSQELGKRQAPNHSEGSSDRLEREVEVLLFALGRELASELRQGELRGDVELGVEHEQRRAAVWCIREARLERAHVGAAPGQRAVHGLYDYRTI